MTNTIQPRTGECEACPTNGILKPLGKMWLCEKCHASELETLKAAEVNQIDVEPSTTPINPRLQRAYIDKFNTLMVSDMTHRQILEHLADLQDMVKVFQTMIQATMDVDEEWSRESTAEEREKRRADDKAYRAKARPSTNADGTIKTGNAKTAKPVIVGDAGTKAFESLVEKLVRTGMSREMAENM